MAFYFLVCCTVISYKTKGQKSVWKYGTRQAFMENMVKNLKGPQDKVKNVVYNPGVETIWQNVAFSK